jgi:hypothetical protein
VTISTEFLLSYRRTNDYVKICACAPTLRPLIRQIFSSRSPAVCSLTVNSHGKESNPASSYDGTRASGEYRLPALPRFYHEFDIEGIAVDNYSYVVTIRADHPETNSRRIRNYWPFGGTRDMKLNLSAPRRSLSRMSNSMIRQQETLPVEQPVMEIVARRSWEMRESFHSGIGKKFYSANEKTFSEDTTKITSRTWDS